ncbi:MAG: ribonuclease J [Deltaproteobacteria bacterium]|jgi:ribonuclease J|nr:ribonuclease J [Deltaproteobacteria bacterium]
MTTKTLDLIPLGGLGEIGLNCMVISYGDDMLVVDAGLMFPDANLPGVDLVIPDFKFLLNNSEKIRALILTHGHEDHIGALAYLLKDLDVPVFGTYLTLALARFHLEEARCQNRNLKLVKARDQLSLGPFDIEFLAVSHSIIDGLALAVTTPVGVIIHTGDFKFDTCAPENEQTDIYSFARYGEKGVLALLSDSTNADIPGVCISESEVGRTLTDIFEKTESRVILACFASSLTRLRQTAIAARATGRRLLFDGRSMLTNVALAREIGYLTINDDELVDIKEGLTLPDRDLTIVVTGSQGEPLSALSRMANKEHKHIKVKPGDTIIFSARAIPGNERAISTIINQFHSLGAVVIDNRFHRIHASGHGQIEELKLMLALTRPKYLIPIHGETYHLIKHASLATDTGLKDEQIKVLTNGQRLCFSADGQAQLGTSVPTGKILVDGSRLGQADDPVIRRRLRLAESGLVDVTLVLEPENLSLAAPPKVEVHGVHYEDEPNLTAEAEEVARLALEEWSQNQNPEDPDIEDLYDSLKRVVRALFRHSINRKPLIWPQVIILPPIQS